MSATFQTAQSAGDGATHSLLGDISHSKPSTQASVHGVCLVTAGIPEGTRSIPGTPEHSPSVSQATEAGYQFWGLFLIQSWEKAPAGSRQLLMQQQQPEKPGLSAGLDVTSCGSGVSSSPGGEWNSWAGVWIA